ncbi:MAG: hypothetical protein ABJB66_10940 [Gemmatimonadaceae bacterium]
MKNRWKLLLVSFAVANARVAAQPAKVTTAQLAQWSNAKTKTPEAQIYRLWQTYFNSKQRLLGAHIGDHSPYWVSDEQKKWPAYDLAGAYQPSDGPAEIVSLKRVSAKPLRYEIAVRFVTKDSGTGSNGNRVAINSTTLVFAAVREGEAWRLANVLPSRTEHWHSEKVGTITYWVDPKLKFNKARALQAVNFADSLAVAFQVPKIAGLDYYVTSSVDVAQGILGVESEVRYGTAGGFAKPANRQIFSGDPTVGENYRHELVHEVLSQYGGYSLLGSEGIATWLGGTLSLRYPDAVKRLNRYLDEHPSVTIDSAIERTIPQVESYVTGAVLGDMISRKGGISGLKLFLSTYGMQKPIHETLTTIFGKSWKQVNIDWRAEVKRIATQRTPGS